MLDLLFDHSPASTPNQLYLHPGKSLCHLHLWGPLIFLLIFCYHSCELHLEFLLCNSHLSQLCLFWWHFKSTESFYHQIFITFHLHFFALAETWHFPHINSHLAQVLITKRPYCLCWLLIMCENVVRAYFLLDRSLFIWNTGSRARTDSLHHFEEVTFLDLWCLHW